MDALKVTLGIDASKDNCECNLSKLTSELKVKVITARAFQNNESGIRESLKWINKNYPGAADKLNVVIEASGVYHERFASGLQEAGFRVSVVLPNKAKKYMESVGIKTKNDR